MKNEQVFIFYASLPVKVLQTYPCSSSSSWSRSDIPQSTRTQSFQVCWRMCHGRTGQGKCGIRLCLKHTAGRPITIKFPVSDRKMFPQCPAQTCAVPLLSSEGEAAVAATFEAADGVSAISMSAQPAEHLTLVHILKRKKKSKTNFTKMWTNRSTLGNRGSGDTFVERSSRQDISSVSKARPSRTNSFKFWCVFFRTFLTIDPPGSPHSAATHVQAILSWQRLAALVFMPFIVAQLTAHV